MRHDNGRFQTQQQLRKIRDASEKCHARGDLFPIHLLIAVILVCAVAIWAGNFGFGVRNILLTESPSYGEFGDLFGVANSAFSGLAFVGVFYSVLLQRKELDTVREERDETRGIFRDQQKNLKQQRFETTFFQLLDAFNGIAETMTIKVMDDKANARRTELRDSDDEDVSSFLRKAPLRLVQGRGAFEELLKHVSTDYAEKHGKSVDVSDRKKSFHEAHARLHEAYGDSLGRYFRSLYTVLNFVEKSFDSGLASDTQERDGLNGDQKFYFKLLRAQLSKNEATLIAINYLSERTTPEFNYLVEKYGMAKNVDFENPIIRDFGDVFGDDFNLKIFGASFNRKLDSWIDKEAENAQNGWDDYHPAGRPDIYD